MEKKAKKRALKESLAAATALKSRNSSPGATMSSGEEAEPESRIEQVLRKKE